MVDFYEYLKILASKITDELVISNMAGVSREWCHAHDRGGNLYQVYMAGPTPVAMGIALALPHRRVIALDSDGSMLMGLTVLPVVAEENPSNLIIIICDNECYEAAGKLPTFTAGKTDLAKVALGAGIRNTKVVNDPSEFQSSINEAFQESGSNLIVLKVKAGHRKVPYSILRGPENKSRFIRYVEKTENIQIITPPAMKL